MRKKVGHIEWLAIKVYFAFCRWVGTGDWFNGFENTPLEMTQSSNVVRSGDDRSATVFQGNPNKVHQKVQATFIYEMEGIWLPGWLTFSGRTNQQVEWSRLFRIHQDVRTGGFIFVPAVTDQERYLLCAPETQRTILQNYLSGTQVTAT